MNSEFEQTVSEHFRKEIALKEKERKLQQAKEKLKQQETELGKDTEKIRRQKQELREKMFHGESLPDPVLDYCFYFNLVRSPSETTRIRQFLSELEKLTGEKILISQTGSSYSSTAIDPSTGRTTSGRNEKQIYLARLIKPAYNFTRNSLG
jgi:hypothetical protein